MWKSTSAPVLWTLLTVLLLTACQPIRPDQDASADTEQTTAAAAEQTEPSQGETQEEKSEDAAVFDFGLD